MTTSSINDGDYLILEGEHDVFPVKKSVSLKPSVLIAVGLFAAAIVIVVLWEFGLIFQTPPLKGLRVQFMAQTAMSDRTAEGFRFYNVVFDLENNIYDLSGSYKDDNGLEWLAQVSCKKDHERVLLNRTSHGEKQHQCHEEKKKCSDFIDPLVLRNDYKKTKTKKEIGSNTCTVYRKDEKSWCFAKGFVLEYCEGEDCVELGKHVALEASSPLFDVVTKCK
ncbi:hypothetical protein P9112_004318 [Eukaryota sp. TZLM1-RC]